MARLRTDKSLIDAVSSELSTLGLDLASADRLRVDEYLEALRDVERRIQKAEQQSASSAVSLVERPVGIPETFEEHTNRNRISNWMWYVLILVSCLCLCGLFW